MPPNPDIADSADPADPIDPATLPGSEADQYDTPWKIALERYFEPFMAFYFPACHAEINWQAGHEFLDKELQAIAKDALIGTRHVDKLVKVWRYGGEEDWLCIHVEVQMARQQQFAQRMFTYNYRIFERYQRPVTSMALLGDEDPNWQPRRFSYQSMGCEMRFTFPLAKLIAYADQQASLAEHPNPFALLTLAYLQNRATKGDTEQRFAVKCSLIRLLLRQNWDKTTIRSFFLVIDWMMGLPPDWSQRMTEFLSQLEKEQEMEYVSSVERYRLEKCRQEGRQEGKHEGKQEGESAMLARLLVRRFGPLPAVISERLQTATQGQLEYWFDCALDATSMLEVFQDSGH